MAPNDSEKTDAEALEDGLRLVVNFLAAALLTGPRNEYLVELQAKYVEYMNVLQAQQNVLENQRDHIDLYIHSVRAVTEAQLSAQIPESELLGSLAHLWAERHTL